jgi:hypothetical protein
MIPAYLELPRRRRILNGSSVVFINPLALYDDWLSEVQSFRHGSW